MGSVQAHRAESAKLTPRNKGNGDRGDRGRTCRRNGSKQNQEHNQHRGVVQAQAATVPGSSASRARDRARTCGLQLLRRVAAVQARRGRHRDPRGHSQILEGAGGDIAAGAGSGPPDRCAVRDRAAVNGQSPRRKAERQELSASLVADLEAWMRERRAKLPRSNDVAKAMDYMLKRWA